MSTTTILAFSFHQQEFTVLEDLVNAMGTNWMEGRQLLFSGKLREPRIDADIRRALAAARVLCSEAENDQGGT